MRTRGYLTEADAFEGYAKAHGEAFADVRPVNTTVLVSLLDPRWLLEIDVEAVVLLQREQVAFLDTPARESP